MTERHQLLDDVLAQLQAADLRPATPLVIGKRTRCEVIRLGTLKCLAGWYQGYTSKTICTELGLIDSQYRVTAKGRAYIWLSCKRGGDV